MRTVSIRVKLSENVEILSFPKDIFDEFIQQNPIASRNIYAILNEQIKNDSSLATHLIKTSGGRKPPPPLLFCLLIGGSRPEIERGYCSEGRIKRLVLRKFRFQELFLECKSLAFH